MGSTPPPKGRRSTWARVAGSHLRPTAQRSSLAHVAPTHSAVSRSGSSSVWPAAKRTTARCATTACAAVHPLGPPQPSASIHTGVATSSPASRPTPSGSGC
ncbi:MAG: hypothetical protein IPN17_28555 [Deltaproteobacteria bacterium]|nr:hypothetical protein [Deltaproteobacteria bacterium]